MGARKGLLMLPGGAFAVVCIALPASLVYAAVSSDQGLSPGDPGARRRR